MKSKILFILFFLILLIKNSECCLIEVNRYIWCVTNISIYEFFFSSQLTSCIWKRFFIFFFSYMIYIYATGFLLWTLNVCLKLICWVWDNVVDKNNKCNIEWAGLRIFHFLKSYLWFKLSILRLFCDLLLLFTVLGIIIY